MKPRVRQAVDRPLACPPRQLTGACAAMLDDHLRRLRNLPGHGNRLPHYDQLLTAHLLAFFDPAVRSLRTLDARSVAAGTMRRSLGDLRLCRSTLSQAMAQMPAEALLPLLKELLARLPEGCSRPDLQDLLTLKKRVCALDGSYFRVPADVLTALAHRRANGKIGRQVRLDLHLDVLRFLPIKAQVDGAARGSESAAFIGQLDAGVVYLADRNFVDFDFLAAVCKAQSDFVVRLKSDTRVTVQDPSGGGGGGGGLTEADRAAGVLRDELVTLPGGRWAPVPPELGQTMLRLVTVWDPVRRQEVRLLTTLLDVPAALIGKLYRQRWCIELFFRWLKCVARVRHLLSESSHGMTMQFYTVLIATLLMHLCTGARPSVYGYALLSWAGGGDLDLEKVPEVLERLARERELERLRRLRKKQA